MYLLTESQTYQNGTSVTGDGTDANNAIDYKFNTYWTATGSRRITVDLGSAKTIDSIWFHCTNVLTWQLSYSTNNSSYANVFSSTQDGAISGYHYHIGFTERTARYWRLTISSLRNSGAPILCYELQLMKLLLDCSEDAYDSNNKYELRRPMEYKFETQVRDSGSYNTYGSTGITGISTLTEKGKEQFSVKWDYIPESIRQQLYNIWLGPPVNPVITVFPAPTKTVIKHQSVVNSKFGELVEEDEDEHPGRIFRARWDGDFDYKYTTIYKIQGFSLESEFLEI